MMRRIAAGVGANSFGMALNIGMQLGALPLFLHYWDAATYGVWLLLSAVPAYLSMADVGMVTAAGNKMTMAVGRGDIAEANRIFQSAQLFMAVVCSGIAALALPLALWAPLHGLESTDQRIALAALCAGVLVSLFGGLAEQVFKSTQRYATGTMLGNVIRLGEWLGMIVGLVVVGSFAAVALGGLTVRVLGLIVGSWMASRGGHGLSWGVRHAERAELVDMVKPAVSFMAFPLANALSFQGVTLVVGAVLGPASVALFNTYRTIARVAVQATALFSHALWPEFSRLFGQAAQQDLRRLFLRSLLLGLTQSVALSLLLVLLAPWLLRVWTHGVIEFVPDLMGLMLAYAAIGGIWHVPRVLLMATNQHVGLALWSMLAGALAVGLSWALSAAFQLNGVAMGMLFSEMGIAVVCGVLALRALGSMQPVEAVTS